MPARFLTALICLAAAVTPAPVPDTEPPSPPGQPVASTVTTTGFTVTWPAATDNVGVVRYTVVASPGGDVVFTGSTAGTTFTYTNLNPGVTYRVGVHAHDAAGGTSAVSPQIFVATLPLAACTATYRIVTAWTSGFVAEVTVRNTGQTTLNGWTVRWIYPAGLQVNQLWNGTLLTNAPDVSVANAAWNGTLAPTPNNATMFGLLGGPTGLHAPPAVTCAAR
jgi:mannan endo-1,4-beta-mannosidase